MATYVALLRGINVGGSRTIRMADLRSLLDDAGYGDVNTYIQSGNVVFDHDDLPMLQLVQQLEAQIEAATGLQVPVMVRTAAEWRSVVERNPYDGVEPAQLHVAFLAGIPEANATDTLQRAAKEPETCVVDGHQVYMHLPNGIGRADLPKGLDRIGAAATVRNWRTVSKLHDLARQRT